ncbi:MAG: hypothetical protein LH649_10620 [Pseudanabaena sp. CAN_BIN31]|nr:hypothetical protein [Pseudanabaena sp. CAN_BIN31]
MYGYGSTTTRNPPEICLNGNDNVDGFILAPRYALGRNGGTTYTGAVWVGQFMTTCGVGNTKLGIIQKGTWDDIGLTPNQLPPSISSIQTWNRKQAQ